MSLLSHSSAIYHAPLTTSPALCSLIHLPQGCFQHSKPLSNFTQLPYFLKKDYMPQNMFSLPPPNVKFLSVKVLDGYSAMCQWWWGLSFALTGDTRIFFTNRTRRTSIHHFLVVLDAPEVLDFRTVTFWEHYKCFFFGSFWSLYSWPQTVSKIIGSTGAEL